MCCVFCLQTDSFTLERELVDVPTQPIAAQMCISKYLFFCFDNFVSFYLAIEQLYMSFCSQTSQHLEAKCVLIWDFSHHYSFI